MSFIKYRCAICGREISITVLSAKYSWAERTIEYSDCKYLHCNCGGRRFCKIKDNKKTSSKRVLLEIIK